MADKIHSKGPRFSSEISARPAFLLPILLVYWRFRPFPRSYRRKVENELKFSDMMIIVGTLILGVLLGAFLVIPRLRKSDKSTEGKSNSVCKESKTYNKAEVSLHNQRTDCWIIIKEKVYDVTSYVEEHPGGDAILAHAGDDSTEGFYGPQHATRVFDMIEDFYIGHLEK